MESHVKRVLSFRKDEQGAVTVDWVVLTASLVSMGMIVGVALWGETGGLSEMIASFIGSQEVISSF